MNTSKKQPTSPEDPVVLYDIYGEELKNSIFSSPSQNKSIDEAKDKQEDEFYDD